VGFGVTRLRAAFRPFGRLAARDIEQAIAVEIGHDEAAPMYHIGI